MPRFRSATIVLILMLSASWVGGLAVSAGSEGPAMTSDRREVGPLASLPPFIPNVDITDGSSPYAWQVEPTMVINSSGTIFVGWKEAGSHDGPGRRVGFSYSEDGGASWAPNVLMPQNHTTPGCANSDPWLARAPDDRVYYAYLEYDCGSGINFPSTRDGRTWGPVPYLAGLGGLSDKESIAVAPSSRLYAAWDEAFLGNRLVVSWSDDRGATWAPFVNPSPSAALGVIVAVAPSGTVYLAWWDVDTNDILFDWSADGGTTWHTDVRVNDAPGSAAPVGNWQIPIPAMNVDPASGAVHVAWPDMRNGHQDIYAATSTNGGLTWSANARVNGDSGVATQFMVDLAVGPDGIVHAAWEDRRNGNWNIFYSNSSDGGQTWTANLRVSDRDTPGSYERPGDYFAIEADSEAVYVVWTDGRGSNFDIFFASNPAFSAATVMIATEPAGLDVVVNGTRSASPIQFVGPPGSTVAVEAPSPQPIGAGARYAWTSWSDGGDAAHVITLGGSTTLVASFRTEYELAIASDVPDTSGGGWYASGSIAYASVAWTTYDVAPGERLAFLGWGGNASGTGTTSNPILMDEPKIAIARYQRQFFLNVQGGFGSGWYGAGTIAYALVDLSGVDLLGPIARQVFAGWNGDASGSGLLSDPIVMDRPKIAIPTWGVEYFVSVESEFAGVQGEGWYAAGSLATLDAPPQIVSGLFTYTFAGWTGDLVSPDATVTVLVNRPIAVRALWAPVGPLGLPPFVFASIVAAAVAAVAAVIVTVFWARRRRSRSSGGGNSGG